MAPEGRRYHVQHVLGRGGFGTVYQAEMLSGGGFAKPVALKVLNQEMGGMAEVAQRLRDEARLLGRLKHPAILRVDDLVQLEGCWTVVMELLAGANLHQIVRAQGALPLGVALEVTHAVAGALHAAHDRPGPRGEPLRVLHRDIKPSNIQLTPHGEVKVLDFGVARASFATREAATRSLIFGSVGYMAPERLTGRDSHAGDVYALGVVLYEILAGRRLGTACSQASLQATMVEQALEGLAQQHPDEELHGLLRATLAFEAEARPRADQLQRRARRLRARYPDPWLNDWAEQVLPGVMGDQALDDGPLSGRVLHERAGRSEAAASGEADEEAEDPRRARFTPLPFEPSEPHTPTAGQPAPWADEIPSEPLGLPPLPPPKDRSPRPTPAATLPRPRPEPRPAAEPTAEPPQPEATASEVTEEDRTRFEPLETPPPAEPERVELIEAGTVAQAAEPEAAAPASTASPAPPSAEQPAAAPPVPREPSRPGRALLLGALLLAATVVALGLALLLGPGRDRQSAELPAEPAEPAEPEAGSAPPPAAEAPPPEEAPVARSPASTTPVRRDAGGITPTSSGAAASPEAARRASAGTPPPPGTSEPEPPADADPPAEASSAMVTVRGDASRVVLKSAQGRFEPGPVPPGLYELIASFPGLQTAVPAGELQASAGDRIVIECQSGFDRCKVIERIGEAWRTE